MESEADPAQPYSRRHWLGADRCSSKMGVLSLGRVSFYYPRIYYLVYEGLSGCVGTEGSAAVSYGDGFSLLDPETEIARVMHAGIKCH